MSSRVYRCVTMICMITAIISALVFDRVADAVLRTFSLLVGSIAAIIAMAVYFYYHWCADNGKDTKCVMSKRLIVFYATFLTISLTLVAVGLARLLFSYTFGVSWIDAILLSRFAALFLTLGGIGLCTTAILGWRADKQWLALMRSK